jgi:polar amino acid transport system substrate-binding protein
MRKWLLGILGISCLLVNPVRAEETERLKVATKSFPPLVFVESDADSPRGYSIDLWKDIATRLDVDYEFVIYDTVKEMLEAVEAGEADVAIAGISITAAREEKVDFSHSYYETGLQIMLLDEPQNPAIAFVGFLVSRETLNALAILCSVSLAAAHLMWFAERHRNPEMFPKDYLHGIWEAFWWSLVTATTVGYGDKSPVSAIGRLIGMIWMFAGIFVVAYFTSAVTTNRLDSKITSIDNLKDKRVGVVANTTSADYLRGRRQIKSLEFKTNEEAYEALKKYQVQAVVSDAPTLLHYIAQNPNFRVVGDLLEKQNYGIAFPQQSEYIEPINRIILQLREEGRLIDLEQKWSVSQN